MEGDLLALAGLLGKTWQVMEHSLEKDLGLVDKQMV